MLLIEGPDMIGKTHLCDRIARELGVKVDKFGLPERDGMVAHCMQRLKPLTVYDRGWISEVVYSIKARGQLPTITSDDCATICRKAEQVGCLTVVVYADDDVYSELVERWWSRGEAFSKEQCKAVNAAYRHLATTNHVLSSTSGNVLYPMRVDVAYCVERIMDRIIYPAQDESFVRSVIAKYREVQRFVGIGSTIDRTA